MMHHIIVKIIKDMYDNNNDPNSRLEDSSVNNDDVLTLQEGVILALAASDFFTNNVAGCDVVYDSNPFAMCVVEMAKQWKKEYGHKFDAKASAAALLAKALTFKKKKRENAQPSQSHQKPLPTRNAILNTLASATLTSS
jgi:hypothetical protein